MCFCCFALEPSLTLFCLNVSCSVHINSAASKTVHRVNPKLTFSFPRAFRVLSLRAKSASCDWDISPRTLPSSNTVTASLVAAEVSGAPSGVIPRETSSRGRWTVEDSEVTTCSDRGREGEKEIGRKGGREGGREGGRGER